MCLFFITVNTMSNSSPKNQQKISIIIKNPNPFFTQENLVKRNLIIANIVMLLITLPIKLMKNSLKNKKFQQKQLTWRGIKWKVGKLCSTIWT